MKNVFAIGAERDGTSRQAQRVLLTPVKPAVWRATIDRCSGRYGARDHAGIGSFQRLLAQDAIKVRILLFAEEIELPATISTR
jgi:hypothetical protein